MTTVNITTNKNTVTVDGGSSVVTDATQGPQGPTFSSSNLSMNDSAKVDGSVIYYSSSAGEYKADNLQTILSLVDGGNF